MSWRTVVISSNAKLDLQMGYLSVRGRETQKIHLSEIHTLIIESTAVSLTAALLAELTRKKVKIVFCDEKRNPFGELLPYYGAHDSSLKIRNQINWSNQIKGEVWTEIVRQKLIQQAINLRDTEHIDASKKIMGYIEELVLNDSTNREGHAAKVYFNAIFGKDFSRGEDNSINAALNYGYAIILSCFNREVASNGYLTQLGLFHENRFNQFNLASDLMEPFRILVDRAVYQWVDDEFGKREKMAIVNILNKEVNINERKETVSNAIKIYCKSVFNALDNQDIAALRFYSYGK